MCSNEADHALVGRILQFSCLLQLLSPSLLLGEIFLVKHQSARSAISENMAGNVVKL